MSNQWHVLSHSKDADNYARVESQISDLDLALALLDRAARTEDPDLVARVSQLARETCACVIGILDTLMPDRDQSARIDALLSKLRQRLSLPREEVDLDQAPPSASLH